MKMARVKIVYKILPRDIEVDLNDIITKIKRNLGREIDVGRFKFEPIAFGLQAILIELTAPEKDGITDEIENNIKRIESIGEVEMMYQSRM